MWPTGRATDRRREGAPEGHRTPGSSTWASGRPAARPASGGGAATVAPGLTCRLRRSYDPHLYVIGGNCLYARFVLHSIREWFPRGDCHPRDQPSTRTAARQEAGRQARTGAARRGSGTRHPRRRPRVGQARAQSALAFKWEQNHAIKAQATRPPCRSRWRSTLAPSRAEGRRLRQSHEEARPPRRRRRRRAEEEGQGQGQGGREASHYPFEDLFFVDVPAGDRGAAAALRRAFAVEPGEYDVYIAVKERRAQRPRRRACPRGGRALAKLGSSSRR